MSSRRQPLLTLSPSQHLHVNRPSDEPTINSPQTTPKLPKRERLASFSRLLKKKRCLENGDRNGFANELDSGNPPRPAVDICVLPCSPTEKREEPLPENDRFLRSEETYPSPNSIPFSPRLLNRKSPVYVSPSYRQPSPLRSPLYTPDNQRVYLGRGSFGKVSLCKYKDRNFAVKVAHNSSSFIGEKNLLGVRHPHLVEIFYISTVLDRTLIFMEFAGHCNLQQILDTKSELNFRRKLSFCIQIATGLRHCHQNQIVHGDVKPANVIVSPLGICKLGDFGNSRTVSAYSSEEVTRRPDDNYGTAAYAAPEVLRGSYPTTASDIYSYGILLWQVDTRDVPFAGEHPHVIIYKVANYGARPKFPEVTGPTMVLYSRTAESCLHPTPEARITASQLLSSLQNIMEDMKNWIGK